MARVINLILLLVVVASVTAMNAERKIKQMERSSSRTGRIFGGKEAQPSQFPHQVSLQTLRRFHFCGGSILSSTWILTAGHCTFAEQPSDFIIAAGSNRLSEVTTYNVTRYIEHPDYDDNLLLNDVSLVQTASKIVFNEFTRPIALINRLIERGILQTSGWGDTDSTGRTPELLQYIDTEVISLEECNRLIPGIPSEDNICIVNPRLVGTCFGDSGGPLIYQNSEEPEGIVGVTSWGIASCGSGYPDGFASVYYFRDWILENTK